MLLFDRIINRSVSASYTSAAQCFVVSCFYLKLSLSLQLFSAPTFCSDISDITLFFIILFLFLSSYGLFC